MLILFNNKFKIQNFKNLKKLNKYKSVKKIANMRKINLIIKFNEINSAILIQQYIRKLFNNENICPITLCKLEYPFVSIKINSVSKDTLVKFRYYSFNEFITYLSKSTDSFKDPLTREELSEKTLTQIYNLLKFFEIPNNTKKLFNKKAKKNIRKKENYFILCNCLNEVINEIFENERLSIDFIYSNIIPQFIYYLHFLFLDYKENCLTLINYYINCINHHNNPNKNIIIDYLNFVKILRNS